MLQKDAIFTNVALKKDRTVYWEGLEEPPAECTDWRGQPWTPASKEPAAHPNSRFTVSIRQAPTYTDEWNNPRGVPISAILFGARRADVVPLVYEAFSWQHGVYLGATMASETTAAATGKVGVVRRDPFAMLPFCGYNMADYFGHWLEVGRRLSHPPKIFRVNWFNRDDNGRFIWPGFGDNLRVLQWMIERCRDSGGAAETAIGVMPTKGAINTEGLPPPAPSSSPPPHRDGGCNLRARRSPSAQSGLRTSGDAADTRRVPAAASPGLSPGHLAWFRVPRAGIVTASHSIPVSTAHRPRPRSHPAAAGPTTA